MGADYSFYVKTIETHVRAFLALNILAIGRVEQHAPYIQFLPRPDHSQESIKFIRLKIILSD